MSNVVFKVMSVDVRVLVAVLVLVGMVGVLVVVLVEVEATISQTWGARGEGEASGGLGLIPGSRPCTTHHAIGGPTICPATRPTIHPGVKIL